MLIHAQFADQLDVDRMFVVPIVLSYTSEGNTLDTINSSSQKRLIDVPVDDALKSELESAITLDSVKQAISDLQEEIDTWGESIFKQFPHLSEETQQRLKSIRPLLNKLIEDSEYGNLQAYDIKKLNERLTQLQDEFEKTRIDADNQIQLLIEAGVDFEKGLNHQKELGEDPDFDEDEDFEPEDDDFEPDDEDFEPEDDDFEPENEDPDWAEHALEELQGKNDKKNKHSRLDSFTEEELAAGMGMRGRVSGPMPGESAVGGTQSGAFGAAPVQTKAKSISDPEAPDYENMVPAKFNPALKQDNPNSFSKTVGT